MGIFDKKHWSKNEYLVSYWKGFLCNFLHMLDIKRDDFIDRQTRFDVQFLIHSTYSIQFSKVSKKYLSTGFLSTDFNYKHFNIYVHINSDMSRAHLFLWETFDLVTYCTKLYAADWLKLDKLFWNPINWPYDSTAKYHFRQAH